MPVAVLLGRLAWYGVTARAARATEKVEKVRRDFFDLLDELLRTS
jgi:hypothetical protein